MRKAYRAVKGVGEDRLSLGTVAVRPADGDDVAVEVAAVSIVQKRAGGIEGGVLLALAGDAVAREIVPVPLERVLDGKAGVEVLIALLRRSGDAVKVVRAGLAAGGVGIAEGEAHWSGRGEVVAEVGHRGARVVLVHRQRVRCIDARVSGQVIEAFMRAAEGAFVLVGVEVASASGVVHHGLEVAAARRAEGDGRGRCVRAV